VILQGRLQRHDIWRSRLEFPAFHSDKIIHLLIQSIRFYLSAQCYFCKGLQLVYLQYNIFPTAGGSTYTPETKRANARARARVRKGGGRRDKEKLACMDTNRAFLTAVRKIYSLFRFRACLQHIGRNIRRYRRPWSFINRLIGRRPLSNAVRASKSNSNNRCGFTNAKIAARRTNRETLYGGISNTSAARVPGFSVRTVAIDRSNGPTCIRTLSTGIVVSRFTRSIWKRKIKLFYWHEIMEGCIRLLSRVTVATLSSIVEL